MDIGSDTPTWKINASVCSSVVNKDLTLKAKDLTFKAKDLTHKAKDLTSEQVEGPLYIRGVKEHKKTKNK